MARILAFVENDMYVRNFVLSGAFDRILSTGEAGIVTSEIVTTLRDRIPAGGEVGRYERSRENVRVTVRTNKVSMLALRKRSETFALKCRARWYGEYADDELRLATRPLQEIRATLRRDLVPNPSVEAVIAEHRPRVVLVPITGVEATGSELVALSRRYGFVTLFLVNGWDNLSSKGVFLDLPDLLGTWGPGSLVDAVEIQGMPVHRCVPMGCARYEPYFQATPGDAPFDHPYVLFAGGTTKGDELTPLRILDAALGDRPPDGMKIVYRPHPWREPRECDDLVTSDTFRNVIVDPQVADAYLANKRAGTESVSATSFPDLGYYPRLLRHAAFVISPLSSMTLEAGLFSVPALVLAHDDGVHTLPPSAVARYRHVAGADEVPGWTFARTLDELPARFAGLCERHRDEGPDRRRWRPVLSAAMKRYLHHDGRSYAERLEEATRVAWAMGEGRTASPEATSASARLQSAS